MSRLAGLTLGQELPSSLPYPTRQTDVDLLRPTSAPSKHQRFNNNHGSLRPPVAAAAAEERIDCKASTADFNRFHFNGFTCYLTLFSKCFSSFPHGTCSLSVSCPYLALDEIYHPFWAAFPNNPTLRKRPVKHRRLAARYGILTLSDVSFQRTWTASYTESASLNYNSPRLPQEISNLSYSRFTRRY